MKNLSLIVNIVLFVALAVLYFLHFSDGKSTDGGATSDLKIAYINSDTVVKYYDYLEVNRKIMEGKTEKLEKDFRARAQGLRGEFDNYQRTVNTLTLSQQKALEEDLGKKQQNLQMYQQSLSQQLAEEEAKLNKELYDRITAYLKKYGEEKGFQVIFKYDLTSDVLYGNAGLDITTDILKGLNEAYKVESAETKGDSTAISK
jgi:outer membrane protein